MLAHIQCTFNHLTPSYALYLLIFGFWFCPTFISAIYKGLKSLLASKKAPLSSPLKYLSLFSPSQLSSLSWTRSWSANSVLITSCLLLPPRLLETKNGWKKTATKQLLFQTKLNPIYTTQTQSNIHHTNSIQYTSHKLNPIYTTQTIGSLHFTTVLIPTHTSCNLNFFMLIKTEWRYYLKRPSWLNYGLSWSL